MISKAMSLVRQVPHQRQHRSSQLQTDHLLHLGSDNIFFWDGARVAPLHEKKEKKMKKMTIQKISLKKYFEHKDKKKNES
jgi:hypothetical protein